MQRGAWEDVERPPKWMHPSIDMGGGGPVCYLSSFLIALPGRT